MGEERTVALPSNYSPTSGVGALGGPAGGTVTAATPRHGTAAVDGGF